jgi:hypothetical protein
MGEKAGGNLLKINLLSEFMPFFGLLPEGQNPDLLSPIFMARLPAMGDQGPPARKQKAK